MNNSIKNFLNQHTGLLIRIDDIAENMNWSLMNKCEILQEVKCDKVEM